MQKEAHRPWSDLTSFGHNSNSAQNIKWTLHHWIYQNLPLKHLFYWSQFLALILKFTDQVIPRISSGSHLSSVSFMKACRLLLKLRMLVLTFLCCLPIWEAEAYPQFQNPTHHRYHCHCSLLVSNVFLLDLFPLRLASNWFCLFSSFGPIALLLEIECCAEIRLMNLTDNCHLFPHDVLPPHHPLLLLVLLVLLHPIGGVHLQLSGVHCQSQINQSFAQLWLQCFPQHQIVCLKLNHYCLFVNSIHCSLLVM